MLCLFLESFKLMMIAMLIETSDPIKTLNKDFKKFVLFIYNGNYSNFPW